MSPLAVAAGILLALRAALPGASAVTLLPPPSRVAREVVLFAPGYGELARIRRTGRHSVAVQTAEEEDRSLLVEVEALPGPGQGDEYREVDPVGLTEPGGDHAGRAVRFGLELGRVDEPAPGQRAAVALPTGEELPAAAAFPAAPGVTCVVAAADAAARRVLRLALPGDELTVRGRVLAAGPGRALVLVEGLEFAGGGAPRDEPPWAVTVRWQGREAALIVEPGDYPVPLPLAEEAEEAEAQHLAVLVRLRAFPAVDLLVGGQRVTAELTATPASRQWGLQGRAGLGAEEGMLFFFERALHPQFVMKGLSFPISVAFIRADGTIAEIGRMEPGDQRGVVSPVPVNYVLEMPWGWFERHGVGPGDAVEFP